MTRTQKADATSGDASLLPLPAAWCYNVDSLEVTLGLGCSRLSPCASGSVPLSPSVFPVLPLGPLGLAVTPWAPERRARTAVTGFTGAGRVLADGAFPLHTCPPPPVPVPRARARSFLSPLLLVRRRSGWQRRRTPGLLLGWQEKPLGKGTSQSGFVAAEIRSRAAEETGSVSSPQN